MVEVLCRCRREWWGGALVALWVLPNGGCKAMAR